jgi:hypothetical protein
MTAVHERIPADSGLPVTRETEASVLAGHESVLLNRQRR